MLNKVAIFLFFSLCIAPFLSHISSVSAEESVYQFIEKAKNELPLGCSMADVCKKWDEHTFTPLHVPKQEYYFFYDNPYRCATFTAQGKLEAMIIYFPEPISKETITQIYDRHSKHVFHPLGTYLSYGKSGILLNSKRQGIACYTGMQKPEVYFANPLAQSAFKDYGLSLW